MPDQKDTLAHSITKNLPAILLALALVTVPLVFLPLGGDLFKHSKALVLFLVTAGLMLALSFNLLRNYILKLVISPFLAGLALIATSTIINTFFTTDYPVEAIIGWGGIYLMVSIIPILIAPLLSKKPTSWPFLSILVMGILLSLTSVLELAGYGPSILFRLLGVSNFSAEGFSAAGSALIAAQVLAISLISSVTALLTLKKNQLFTLFALPIIVVGLAINVWLSLPGQAGYQPLPPLTASWNVAIEALRSPRAAFLGVGPEQYQEIYTQLRPIFINSTEVWNVRFAVGSNTPLTLFTGLGLLGLGGWLMLVVSSVKVIKQVANEDRPIYTALMSTFVVQLLFPPSIVIATIQMVLLTVLIARLQKLYPQLELHPLSIKFLTKENKSTKQSEYSTGFSYALVALILVISAGFSWTLGRSYLSLAALFQAEVAASNQELIGVYDANRTALGWQPNWDITQRAFANSSLSVALALSSQEEPSQEEVAQIQQLIRQSIERARFAALINPANAANWSTVAGVYQELIGVADGAEQFAIDNYLQAINRAPSDPALRLSLGTALYQAGEYQQAVRVFQQAIELKPDLPIAYYNIANALAEVGSAEQAEAFYNQAKTVARQVSQDEAEIAEFIDQINQELEQLPERVAAAQERIAQQQAAAAQNQQTPPTPEAQQNNLPAEDLNLLDETLSDDQTEEPVEISQPEEEQSIEENNEQIEEQN